MLAVTLLAALAGCSSEPPPLRSLTILHTNDLHARFLPDGDQLGGFAHLATAIQQEKQKSQAALVLHGGDLVQGTPVSTIYEGVPVFEVADHLGIDVNTLGNHEFDYGWQKIPEFLAAARFPTVAVNVVDEHGELLAGPAFVIRELNGVRVGIIGALTETLPSLTRKENRGSWRALPVAATVREFAQQIRDGVELVVVVAHLTDAEDEQLLREVPEVDIIVSGHNHQGQDEAKVVDGRICVKVAGYGRELGRLDLTFDLPADKIASFEWKRIPIDSRVFPPDPTVALLVEQWEAKVASIVDVPIATSARRFDQAELQPMIEQALLQATSADIAYMNRGGIRDNLPQGQILARHVWNMLPFDNHVVVGRLKGKDLPEEAANGRGLDPEKEYRVATNNFVGDQWSRFGIDLPETGPVLRDVFLDWVKQKKVIE